MQYKKIVNCSLLVSWRTFTESSHCTKGSLYWKLFFR